ncbi:hypothetical protein BMH30_08400, partial [Leucobacter sp. OLES1]
DGYPVVVFGHMTTGGSDAAAPSRAHPAHVEWRRISQGDALCARLLRRGIAVLRPDYEGIGSSGTHPYLIGASLGESMLAAMRARRSVDERLGDRWVLAGHSEGAVAALFASVAPAPDPDARLLGTAVFAPVTRMDRSIALARRFGVAMPGKGTVSALIGLMLSGAAEEDPGLKQLIEQDGLSDRAREAWGDLGERTLVELIAPDSWGGIAPSGIGGPRQAELWERLFASFARNEVGLLHPVEHQPPLRIDAALLDEVAPAPLTAALLRGYRRAGFELTSRWWPTHHSGVMRADNAPSEAAGWIADRFAV